MILMRKEVMLDERACKLAARRVIAGCDGLVRRSLGGGGKATNMASNQDNTRNIMITVIVVAAIVCLTATAFALMKLGVLPTVSAAGIGESAPSQWKLDEFIVNLADGDEARYLKVNIVLEVSGRVERGGEDTPNPEEIKARDAIITVLTRKTYRELLSDEGKTSLKAQLKDQLNTVLSGFEVKNIYFTSFAMQ